MKTMDILLKKELNIERTRSMKKFDGDNSTGITYKKRYAVSNGDINSALKTAAKDGIDGN